MIPMTAALAALTVLSAAALPMGKMAPAPEERRDFYGGAQGRDLASLYAVEAGRGHLYAAGEEAGSNDKAAADRHGL